MATTDLGPCISACHEKDRLGIRQGWCWTCVSELRRGFREELAAQERAHGETIDQRDRAHEAADALAYAIAPIETIGEHSNLNDPWANALEQLEGERQSTLEAMQAGDALVAILKNALRGLVGVSTRTELEQLEAVMRLMPAPAEDKAATIDAIHALIAVAEEE